MNGAILNERLQRVIAEQADMAVSSRQVSQRLKALLPQRFREIKRDANRAGLRGSRAERHALVDERYTKALEEYVNITYAGVEARIQYETHRMLFEARRSLRLFKA